MENISKYQGQIVLLGYICAWNKKVLVLTTLVSLFVKGNVYPTGDRSSFFSCLTSEGQTKKNLKTKKLTKIKKRLDNPQYVPKNLLHFSPIVREKSYNVMWRLALKANQFCYGVKW